MISFLSLLSFSALAENDVAQGSCQFKISRNKSKHRVLRTSQIDYDSILIKPLNRFLAVGSTSRITINPEDVLDEHKNRVIIFSKDKERLDVLSNVQYEIEDFKKAIYFTVEYIGEGLTAGSFNGPGLRISTMTQEGQVAENFFGLKKDKETDFQVNVPAKILYRIFNKVDGEPKQRKIKEHKSKVQLKCSFKVIDEATLVEDAPVDEESIEIESESETESSTVVIEI
jgi:hypothetical protein